MPDTKRCPYCAEEIRGEAVRCRYCRSRLSGFDVGQSLYRKRLHNQGGTWRNGNAIW